MPETIINEQKLQLPLLLTDGFFLFPKCSCSLPLTGENERLKPILIQAWKEHQGQLLIISSRGKIVNPNLLHLEPDLTNFYSIGTWGKIALDLTCEADAESIINSLQEIRLEGLERIKVVNPIKINDYWKGEYQVLLESEPNRDEKYSSALIEKFVKHLPNILKKTDLALAEKLPYLAMGSLGNFIDFLAQINLEMPRQTKQAILSSVDLSQRLDYLLGLVVETNEQKSVDKDISNRANAEAKKEEKIYRLRKIIGEAQKELQKLEGSDTSNWEQKHLQRLEKEPFPESVKTAVRTQIDQFKTVPPHFGEANIIRNYVDLLMALPWWQSTPENHDLSQAQQVLDQGHFGSEKVKKTITEQLAVIQYTGKVAGRIICFVGPPGVGKTSLAKLIARAMGRKFFRISLGGIRDVALILGFRRTYVGAVPGRIIQGFKQVGANNPVILLDEVDKVNRLVGHQGDATSALLEVLDPEQNQNFADHYLEIPFDCSRALFICTANYLWDIPKALRDRMEIITLSSYTSLEKLAIAQNHLIPRKTTEYKLEPSQIVFPSLGIEFLINHYTRESGVRELNRLIRKILQIFIKDLLQKKVNKLPVKVTPKLIQDKHYLGKIIYDFTEKEENPQPGVVNGLAWTETGGDILPIEVNYYPGKGKLEKLTGSLGDVMKESVVVAFNYVRNYLENEAQIETGEEKIENYLAVLNKSNFNLHAPEGAVKKDGPSAGIAITTAVLSALTKKIIPADIGMTGEITLTGNVLAIGGLREKSIAACRSKLKTIFIPKKNEKDLEDIPAEIRKELKIILVSKYQEVWENLFPPKIVPRIMEITTAASAN